jgi:23S rRNA (cytidine1920-2'-O)/16S rRNA (cytidine1409-2'-O)-methyltransferase
VARRRRRSLVRLGDRPEVASAPDPVNLIARGRVMVNGLITRNPNAMVDREAIVTLVRERTLRGTRKLRDALAGFEIDVTGQVCLDLGAAAGGFTAALLEAGAGRVYAVDVGYGQLAGWLRQHPRVVNLERTNIGQLGPLRVPEMIETICMDLSYLSVASALPQLARIQVAADAQLVALVKPTFELGARSVIVDDESVRKAIMAASEAAKSCGWRVEDRIVAVGGPGHAPEGFIHGVRTGSR